MLDLTSSFSTSIDPIPGLTICGLVNERNQLLIGLIDCTTARLNITALCEFTNLSEDTLITKIQVLPVKFRVTGEVSLSFHATLLV